MRGLLRAVAKRRAGSGGVRYLDNFNGANDTLLTNHVSDSGHGYDVMVSYSPGGWNACWLFNNNMIGQQSHVRLADFELTAGRPLIVEYSGSGGASLACVGWTDAGVEKRIGCEFVSFNHNIRKYEGVVAVTGVGALSGDSGGRGYMRRNANGTIQFSINNFVAGAGTSAEINPADYGLAGQARVYIGAGSRWDNPGVIRVYEEGAI